MCVDSNFPVHFLTSIMKKFLPSLVIAFLLTGCTTTYKTSENVYTINQAPNLSDLIKIDPSTPKQVFDIYSNKRVPQGKFESDQDYKNRTQRSSDIFFMVFPLRITDSQCKSSYDRAKGFLNIVNCSPDQLFGPMYTEKKSGESIRLSNAFDSRVIEKQIIDNYKGFGSVLMKDFQFNIPIENAKSFQEDLMFGVLMKVESVNKVCEDCQSRALSELVAQVGKDKSVDWKNTAFKSGVITETTTHNIFYKAIEVYVFSKSSQKVYNKINYTEK